MLKSIILALCLSVLSIPAGSTADNTPELESMGVYRITEYCEACSGDTTALGETPREGIIASDPNDIPYGSTIIIDGVAYTMADYCGYSVDVEPTIDIYRNWSDGNCHCSRLEYIEVFGYEKREEK